VGAARACWGCCWAAAGAAAAGVADWKSSNSFWTSQTGQGQLYPQSGGPTEGSHLTSKSSAGAAAAWWGANEAGLGGSTGCGSSSSKSNRFTSGCLATGGGGVGLLVVRLGWLDRLELAAGARRRAGPASSSPASYLQRTRLTLAWAYSLVHLSYFHVLTRQSRPPSMSSPGTRTSALLLRHWSRPR